MIEKEVFQALECYALQVNLFLEFTKLAYPELTEVEAIHLATLTLSKLIKLLSQHKVES